MKTFRSHRFGFTIVELLVVIVIIGILAAITIVTYTGIAGKATLASLTSDLDNASKQLKVFQTINGSYPASINDCPTPASTNMCLKFSPSNTITYYAPNNSTSPQTFNLTLSNNGLNGVVTDNSKPSLLTPAPLSPVADWIATYKGYDSTHTGDHYGNFYDAVSHSWATVSRIGGGKTIYDPTTQHIYDVPDNYLGVIPRSDDKSGAEALIEEGRTNYLTNSYGSTNDGSKWTGGWGYVPQGLHGVPTYSLVQGAYRSTALRVQYTGQLGDSNADLLILWATPPGNFSPGDNATTSF